MKHQGGVGSWTQRKGLQVRIVPWRAQGGQWGLFPATFPGVTVAVFFILGPTGSELSLSPPCPTGCVPLDPQLSQSLEEGRDFIQEFPKSSAFPALTHIAQQILDTSQRSS